MRIALMICFCFLLVSWNSLFFSPSSIYSLIEKSVPSKKGVLEIHESHKKKAFNPVLPKSKHAEHRGETKTYSFQIVLDPKERTIFSAEVNAQVLKIHKRMGDAFEEGDILISLDDRVAKALYEKTLAKRRKSFIELEGKKQLYSDNLISFFEVKDAEAAFAEADSDFISAEKTLHSTKIIAPYRGKVARLGIQEFEYAQVGKELLETVEDDILHGRFLASAFILPCLKAGETELFIEMNESPYKRKAVLTRLSPVIDAASATIQVEVDIDNRDRLWLPGMAGRVTIECPSS